MSESDDKKACLFNILTCVTLTSSYHVTLTSNEMNWMVFLISLTLTFWLDVTLTLKGTENLNSMISLISEILTFWSGVTLTLKGNENLNLTLNLTSVLVPFKETKSATMNIFRFFCFLFKSFVKVELSYVFTINLLTIAENCTEK